MSGVLSPDTRNRCRPLLGFFCQPGTRCLSQDNQTELGLKNDFNQKLAMPLSLCANGMPLPKVNVPHPHPCVRGSETSLPLAKRPPLQEVISAWAGCHSFLRPEHPNPLTSWLLISTVSHRHRLGQVRRPTQAQKVASSCRWGLAWDRRQQPL